MDVRPSFAEWCLTKQVAWQISPEAWQRLWTEAPGFPAIVMAAWDLEPKTWVLTPHEAERLALSPLPCVREP